MITDETARNERILALRDEGKNLRTMGEEFGLTRERVRQILADEGVRSMTRAERIQMAAAKWRASGVPRHAADVAAEYGLSTHASTVVELRRACPELALPDVRPLSGGRRGMESMAESVRRVAIEQGIDPATGWISAVTYSKHRQPGDVSTAGVATLGTWSEVLVLAGFSLANRPKIGRPAGTGVWSKQYSDEYLDSVILAFFESKPAALTTATLTDFLDSHEDLPSAATVRNRFRKRGVDTIAGIFADVLERHEVPVAHAS